MATGPHDCPVLSRMTSRSGWVGGTVLLKTAGPRPTVGTSAQGKGRCDPFPTSGGTLFRDPARLEVGISGGSAGFVVQYDISSSTPARSFNESVLW